MTDQASVIVNCRDMTVSVEAQYESIRRLGEYQIVESKAQTIAHILAYQGAELMKKPHTRLREQLLALEVKPTP